MPMSVTLSECDLRPTEQPFALAQRFVRLFFRNLWRSGVLMVMLLIIAIGVWLMQQSGARPTFFLPWGTTSQEQIISREEALQEAVDRFAALSSGEQRAWLEANWDALRAAELTLEDLP